MAQIIFNNEDKKYYIDIDFNVIANDAVNNKYTAVKCYTENKKYYLAVITWFNHCIEMFKLDSDTPNIRDIIINNNPINKTPIYNFTIEF